MTDANEELETRINFCAGRLAAIIAKLQNPRIARSPLAAVLADNARHFQQRHDDLVSMRGLSAGLIVAGLGSL